MRNFALLTIACVAFAAEPGALEKALTEGRALTDANAATLENSLQSDAENADARARLLGYYFHIETAGSQAEIPIAHASRLRHVQWLVENHPESEIAAAPQTRMFYLDGGPEYQKLRDLWMQQAQRFPQDARVLKNAADFLMGKDADVSLKLLKQAAVLQPEDGNLSERLGMTMASMAMNTRGANASLAQQVRGDLRGCGSVTPSVCKSAAAQFSTMVMARRGTPDFRPEDAELAANLLATARTMEPDNPRWTLALNSLADPTYRSAGRVVGGVLGGIPSAVPNPPGLSVPGTIRVGGNVQAANLLKQVPPVYPALAKQARIQGTVRFSTVIGKDGTIEDLQLVSGHPLLVQAAQEAVKQWVYKPTLLNGEPVQVITTIDVNFTLNQ